MPFGLLCSIIIDELRLLTLSVTAGNVLASSSRWTSGSSHLGHRRQVQFRRSGSGHVFGCVQLQEPDALGDVLVVERPPRLHVLPAPEEQETSQSDQLVSPVNLAVVQYFYLLDRLVVCRVCVLPVGTWRLGAPSSASGVTRRTSEPVVDGPPERTPEPLVELALGLALRREEREASRLAFRARRHHLLGLDH